MRRGLINFEEKLFAHRVSIEVMDSRGMKLEELRPLPKDDSQ